MLILQMSENGKDHIVHLTDKDTGERIGEFRLLDVKGNQVRIGFDFEDWVSIQRDCVKQRGEGND